MTVCIGAICDGHIVTVSDTKLSTGHYSHEIGSLKLREVHYLWRVLVSGKFSHTQPLLDMVAWEAVSTGKDEPSLEDMVTICTKAYQRYAVKLAEEKVLTNFGLSMEQFLKSRAKLGTNLYGRIWGDISRVQVGCDLLVCGYSAPSNAHIFIVSNPTDDHPSFITYCDAPGFGVIGSGSVLAESTLFAFEQSSVMSLEDTIYHTTFAKFTAESAQDVGEITHLRAFDGHGNVIEFDPSLSFNLRERYMAKGRPSIPADTVEIISTGLRTAARHETLVKPIFLAAVRRWRELQEQENKTKKKQRKTRS